MNGAPNTIRFRISDPSLLIVPLCACTFGFVSGLLSASQRSSLQFLAENAHRQPTTLQGWYFYNKTKNYRVALAAVRGGIRTAARMGGWTGGFVAMKEGCGRAIGLGNIQSGALSGFSMAIAASALCAFLFCPHSSLIQFAEAMASPTLLSTSDRLPYRNLSRQLLLGISVGALTGGLQELRDLVARQRQIENKESQHK